MIQCCRFVPHCSIRHNTHLLVLRLSWNNASFCHSFLLWLHHTSYGQKYFDVFVIWFFLVALRPTFTAMRPVHWWHLPLTAGTKRHLKCMKLPSSKRMWGPLCSRQLNQDLHYEDVSCTIHTVPAKGVPKHQEANLTNVGHNSSTGSKCSQLMDEEGLIALPSMSGRSALGSCLPRAMFVFTSKSSFASPE